jgi:hypothetical protein
VTVFFDKESNVEVISYGIPAAPKAAAAADKVEKAEKAP